MLLGNIKNFEQGAGKRRFEQGRQEAWTKEQELLGRLRALPDGERKAEEEAKRMIDRVRTFIGYRDYPKYGMISRYFVYKQALLEEAERLVLAHVLREKEEIFYLTFQELADLPVGFFPDILTAATPGEAFPKKGTDMTITKQPVDNGVNSDALLSARTALTEAPEAAEFTWRSTCSWVHGTFSQSTVTGFSGLGQEHTHRVPYTFDADHPECFASEDRGAAPVEIVLAALGSCLTAGVAAVAQYRGIQLRSVTATVEGSMNILGILGADPDVRNGFSGVTVHFDIDADASPQEIEALVAQSQKRSAVFDLMTNPTKVVVNTSSH